LRPDWTVQNNAGEAVFQSGFAFFNFLGILNSVSGTSGDTELPAETVHAFGDGLGGRLILGENS